MRYHALATDYDGTLASDGHVDAATMAALRRLRASGRKLLLVTGRELEDLRTLFGEFALFDRIVAENGAVLLHPATQTIRVLTEPPKAELVNLLRQRGVAPLSVGHGIVATFEPHEVTLLEAIRELGLEEQVIFNKGAVMALPSGINKATGLTAALKELGLKAEQVVGIGDAENDHAFLELCGFAVAVSNALPALKEKADMVTEADHGAGVTELIDLLLHEENRLECKPERQSGVLHPAAVEDRYTPAG